MALRKALNGYTFAIHWLLRALDRQQAGMGSIGVVDPYGSQPVMFFAPPQSGTLIVDCPYGRLEKSGFGACPITFGECKPCTTFVHQSP